MCQSKELEMCQANTLYCIDIDIKLILAMLCINLISLYLFVKNLIHNLSIMKYQKINNSCIS